MFANRPLTSRVKWLLLPLCVAIGVNTVRPLFAQIAAPCVPSPAGLVAWWPGDGNADDIAGFNDGTLLGGATFAPGKVRQAFAFNGGTSGVRIPANPVLNVGAGGGLTIETWINPSDLSLHSPLVEYNRGGTTARSEWGVHLWVLQTGDLGLGAGVLFANLIEANGTDHFLFSAAGTIAANTLQHVAVTYDKTTGLARLYRNGQIVAEANFGTIVPVTSYDLYLGRRPAGDTTVSYVGLLDEVSIYNRALSQADIQAIYNAGAGGKCLPGSIVDGLIALVNASNIPRNKQPLLASLNAAAESYNLGDILLAESQLRAFQNKVRAQVAPTDPTLAAVLIAAAQQIIDAT
jgi:hypothetical protein